MIGWLRTLWNRPIFGADAADGITCPQALGLVRRARSGDQNAMALIAGTYQAVRAGGNPQADKSLQTILQVIRTNPPPAPEAFFEGRPRTPSRFGPDRFDTPMYNTQFPHSAPRFGPLPFPWKSSPARFGTDPGPPPATAALSVPSLSPTPETAAHLGVLKWASRGSTDDATDQWCLQLCGQALLHCASCGDQSAIPIAIVILAQGAPLSATRVVGLIEQAPSAIQAPLDHAVTNSSTYPDPQASVGFGGPGSVLNPVQEAGRAIGQARRLQAVKHLGAPITDYAPAMAGELADRTPHDSFGNPVKSRSMHWRSELRNAS